jgi:hypothetical protein
MAEPYHPSRYLKSDIYRNRSGLMAHQKISGIISESLRQSEVEFPQSTSRTRINRS